MIKLIVFDLWKTLVYRDVKYSTIQQILDNTLCNIPKDKLVKIFENSIQTQIWNSKYDAYAHLCENMGLEKSKDNVNLLMNIRDNAEEKTKVYPHTIKMLKDLKKQGYKIGLISNSSVFAAEVVRKKTNVLDYIDYPLFSFEVGVIKPDLKIYKRMLEIAKCKPEETIMIGDNEKDDVIPSRKLGMKSILYTDHDSLKKGFGKHKIVI